MSKDPGHSALTVRHEATKAFFEALGVPWRKARRMELVFDVKEAVSINWYGFATVGGMTTAEEVVRKFRVTVEEDPDAGADPYGWLPGPEEVSDAAKKIGQYVRDEGHQPDPNQDH